MPSAAARGSVLRARIPSIDLLRLVAIFAVILIHAKPFDEYATSPEKYFSVLINQSARFAVPYLFIIAGYLWGRRIRSGTSPDAMLGGYGGRVLSIFLFWSAFYFCVPASWSALVQTGWSGLLEGPSIHVLRLLDSPVAFLLEGPKVHLWFLVALLSALALATLFLKRNRPGWLLVTAAGLYAFGLLAGSYSATPIGIAVVNVNTRNGPFFATLFFAVGWLLSGREEPVSLRCGVLLLLAGYLLHLTEAFALWRWCQVYPTGHDFLLGTLPFAAGLAMVALARPSLGQDNPLVKLAPYTLGLYAIHFFFIDLLRPAHDLFPGYLWELMFPLLVYALSLVTAIGLATCPPLKRFVS